MSDPVTRAELDAVLDERLGKLLTTLDERLDTKLDERMDKLDERLGKLLAALDERLDTKLERLENRLVSQFWDWARPREKRERSYRARLSSAEAQLSALQERVRIIEDRDDPSSPSPAA